LRKYMFVDNTFPFLIIKMFPIMRFSDKIEIKITLYFKFYKIDTTNVIQLQLNTAKSQYWLHFWYQLLYKQLCTSFNKFTKIDILMSIFLDMPHGVVICTGTRLWPSSDTHQGRRKHFDIGAANFKTYCM